MFSFATFVSFVVSALGEHFYHHFLFRCFFGQARGDPGDPDRCRHQPEGDADPVDIIRRQSSKAPSSSIITPDISLSKRPSRSVSLRAPRLKANTATISARSEERRVGKECR